MHHETTEEHVGKDLISDGETWYPSTVVTQSFVALSLTTVKIVASLDSCARVSLSQNDWNSAASLLGREGPTELNTSAGMASNLGAFPVDICFIALATPSSVRVMSKSGHGVVVNASSLMDNVRLRTSLKCSAHLSTILSLLEMSVAPSALRRGESLMLVVRIHIWENRRSVSCRVCLHCLGSCRICSLAMCLA